MELTLGTPALLFSTVSLLMIAFTNRFLAIAGLIRDLHDEFKNHPQERNLIIRQIATLQRRIRLIRNMQIIAILSLILSAFCMFLLFLGNEWLGRWFFGGGLIMQIIALVLSVIEIRISIDAIKIELSDMTEEIP